MERIESGALKLTTKNWMFSLEKNSLARCNSDSYLPSIIMFPDHTPLFLLSMLFSASLLKRDFTNEAFPSLQSPMRSVTRKVLPLWFGKRRLLGMLQLFGVLAMPLVRMTAYLGWRPSDHF